MKYHQKVEGGDEVLIDLGGYGIQVFLADDKSHYDIRYVVIDYTNSGQPIPKLLPADMVISKPEMPTMQIQQAHKVEVWRHSSP